MAVKKPFPFYEEISTLPPEWYFDLFTPILHLPDAGYNWKYHSGK
jgi:hypothetical protein